MQQKSSLCITHVSSHPALCLGEEELQEILFPFLVSYFLLNKLASSFLSMEAELAKKYKLSVINRKKLKSK